MYPSSQTERLGVAAGVVVTGMLVGLFFVGPWRVFAVEFGDTFPLRILEQTRGNPFAAATVGSLFVGFVTGAAYPQMVHNDGDDGNDGNDGDDHEWGDLAMGIFVPPLVLLLLGLLGLLLAPAVGSLLVGSFAGAAAQAVVGVLFAAIFAGVVGTVLAIGVGIPALAGVYVGVLVGKAAAPD
jgi:hypothetical protein